MSMRRRGRGLRMGVVVALTAAVLPVAVMSGTADALPRPAMADEPGLEAELLELINASRAAEGLKPLQRHPILDQAADEWTAYMIDGKCNTSFPLCHRSKASLKAMANAASAPYGARWWAENAQRTAQNARYSHERLMTSPGHRANIMRPATNLIGIGVAIAPSGYMYITEEFAESKAPPPPPPKVTHPCGKVTKTLVYGSRGTQVKTLQCALAALGLYQGGIDGRYGKATRTAVREFQRLNGLSVTGKASLTTRRVLGVSK